MRTIADRLMTAWATTLAVLLVATWPLWTAIRAVPRIAPFGASPAAIELALLIAMVWGLVIALRGKPGQRPGCAVATIGLFLLMASDQLRWQPWAYHALLVGAMLAIGNARRTTGALRTVAIAVYAYSAVAKLDAEFAATLGRQMVGVLLGAVGLDASSLDGPLVRAAAMSLPVGELAMAGLLAASLKWRRLAAPACLVVGLAHATTIAVLCPWGLGHSAGVLLWNIGFAWQTIVLFGLPTPAPDEEAPAENASGGTRRAALLVVGIAVVAPLATPFGCWDQWPGWALYAPGGERAELLVHADAVDSLPESLWPHTKGVDGWHRVHLDDWALEQTGAPIYPQNRVVAALAVGLIERGFAEDRLRVVLASAADRATRERSSETLRLRYQFEAASRLFGTRPAVEWTR